MDAAEVVYRRGTSTDQNHCRSHQPASRTTWARIRLQIDGRRRSILRRGWHSPLRLRRREAVARDADQRVERRPKGRLRGRRKAFSRLRRLGAARASDGRWARVSLRDLRPLGVQPIPALVNRTVASRRSFQLGDAWAPRAHFLTGSNSSVSRHTDSPTPRVSSAPRGNPPGAKGAILQETTLSGSVSPCGLPLQPTANPATSSGVEQGAPRAPRICRLPR